MKTIENLKYQSCVFPDVFVIKSKKFVDERGFFYENFKENFFIKNFNFKVIQENISSSSKNVLRGMHYQIYPFSQSKLISVNKGKILDVFVDLRKNSRTYKFWGAKELDSNSGEQLLLPRGFAHGFLSLENETLVTYKIDNVYNQKAERSIIWNDNSINIVWPTQNPILSYKDANAKTFLENEKEFKF